jgi:hypothetical protein
MEWHVRFVDACGALYGGMWVADTMHEAIVSAMVWVELRHPGMRFLEVERFAEWQARIRERQVVV